MVCVDSSVWIRNARGGDETVDLAVTDLIRRGQVVILGQIWLELVGGYRRAERRREFVRSMSAYPWLPVTDETWRSAAELFASHQRVGMGDALIAAACIEHEAPLYTLDADLAALKRTGLKLHIP